MAEFFSISGRADKGSYGLFTIGFAVVVFGLAEIQSGAPVTQMMSSPWLVLGRALDEVVQVPDRLWDMVISLGLGLTLVWGFVAFTIRRLRDAGQSPWWTLLFVFSNAVVLSMIVLSFLPSAIRAAPRRTETPDRSLAIAD
ncbi:DUF805 domain-containing protein [Brevundimonas subvibrioides]|uniref:DUF805 domain-containing protein n=1 Tax=Brevundimonas subvibrioides TaxID=74313 RepID=UPI0022B4CD8C|nr:DUF805 domain-containing protein [Brevundimonas subvibrioides]